MNIIAVDDERRALNILERAIQSVAGDAVITGFTSAKEALKYAREQQVDIAFLDIKMMEMSGVLLAKCLKDIYGNTNIIFVTAYSQYMSDAFALRVSGYVQKPITPERVYEELNHLRNPILVPDMGIRVQCFGNFEVFVKGRPLRFLRGKTKELLAYLIVRRGAQCNNNEIIGVLWEDKANSSSLQSYFRQLVADLTKTLRVAGIPEMLIRHRGSMAVLPEKISCDLYDFCDGKNVNLYKGEFMSQYSWAEFINAYLNQSYL